MFCIIFGFTPTTEEALNTNQNVGTNTMKCDNRCTYNGSCFKDYRTVSGSLPPPLRQISFVSTGNGTAHGASLEYFCTMTLAILYYTSSFLTTLYNTYNSLCERATNPYTFHLPRVLLHLFNIPAQNIYHVLF